jgi:hypothetical protein
MICQNLFWDGENLTYNLLKPFDAIYQHASQSLWQGRQDSNLRPSVLETDALPTELLPYIALKGLNLIKIP